MGYQVPSHPTTTSCKVWHLGIPGYTILLTSNMVGLLSRHVQLPRSTQKWDYMPLENQFDNWFRLSCSKCQPAWITQQHLPKVLRIFASPLKLTFGANTNVASSKREVTPPSKAGPHCILSRESLACLPRRAESCLSDRTPTCNQYGHRELKATKWLS